MPKQVGITHQMTHNYTGSYRLRRQPRCPHARQTRVDWINDNGR